MASAACLYGLWAARKTQSDEEVQRLSAELTKAEKSAHAKVSFHFSLILCLPRAVLGVSQPGLRGGPRRDLIGAKETRRAPPGEALAG